MMLIDLRVYPVKPVLSQLLQDKTTKRNILFATDAYIENGAGYDELSEITAEKLLCDVKVPILPRVEKAADEQLSRTRKKAEVFTPSWIVNEMNNHCDEAWFGRPNVFDTPEGTAWRTTDAPIAFPKGKTWKQYVDARRLEITCGEAPYIVSRYDAATGEIIPYEDRIGILDRKLRIVNENAADDAEWHKWTERAFQSTYGYEFQGDNLLIARVNLLLTFAEHYERRFGSQPAVSLLKKFTTILCWNLWQMDGRKYVASLSCHDEETALIGFGDKVPCRGCQYGDIEGHNGAYCRIFDWRANCSLRFIDMMKGARR